MSTLGGPEKPPVAGTRERIRTVRWSRPLPFGGAAWNNGQKWLP